MLITYNKPLTKEYQKINMEKVECCNFWKRHCYVKLNTTEEICPACHGHGAFFVSAHFKVGIFEIWQCNLCKGEGKVDWITHVTKRSRISYPVFGKSKEIPIKCNRIRGCKRVRRLYIEHQRAKKQGIEKRRKHG